MSAQNVDIADANLRTLILNEVRRLNTDKPPAETNITEEDMALLTELDARDEEISDLTGLETAINLTTLDLGENDLTSLPTNVFKKMTKLTTLYLDNNQLGNELPEAIFSGLTALTSLWLQGNIQDGNVPLKVELKAVDDNGFKAVVPNGAPFDIRVGLLVSKVNLSSGRTLITIPKGKTETEKIIATLRPGRTGNGEVEIVNVPRIPTGTDAEGDAYHRGYFIQKAGKKVTITNPDPPTTHAPVFTEGDTTTRDVYENTPAGQTIGSAVSATDADGDTLTYTLRGTDAAAFGIVSTSGHLKTKAALDYETKNRYTVTVTVEDPEGNRDRITVTIDVLNIVDENSAPAFAENTPARRSIAENTAAGTNIGNPVSATDADNDTLTYTLDSTGAAAFSIVSTSGQLQTKAALDYETKSSYSFTITVSDGELTDVVGVIISVTDVDEQTNNAPVFTEGATATRSIAENTAAGTNIGSPVSATDADNDTLTYTLGGTDASSFSIVSSSGQLQTSAALDYETKNSYAVVVSVSDGNGGSDSIAVTINVTDVNEQAPPPTNQPPTFSEGTSTTRSIAENTPANRNIGSPISATDANNDALTYTLSGTDAAAFRIVSTSGQLRTAAALDYETKNSYTVTVTVRDTAGTSDTITVTINVTDINEQPPPASNQPPTFSEGTSTTRSIAENTPANRNIGSPVSATDANNDALTYTLSGTDAAAFRIVSSSGQLRTSAALDYETKNSYTVTVTVRDTTGTSDSITVTINVTDINEQPPPANNQPPTFSEGASTTRSIAENTAAGTNIGSPVSATDANNDALTYTLSGTDAAAFRIVSSSGQLRTSAALDYETKNSYTVTVTVRDTTGTSDSITVTINVTDVNEAPLADDTPGDDTPADDTPADDTPGDDTPADDTPADDTPADDTPADDTPADDTPADDTPASNQPPTFSEGAFTTRSIAENTAAGTNIGSPISATDANNDALTYTLGGTDAALFGIVSTSGQLQTAAALDYETKNRYTFTVTVQDTAGTSATIIVTINVTDVNEQPPPADDTPADDTPAVDAPVQPPVEPPVQPPVDPSVQPPVEPPVEPPVQPSVEPPVEPPPPSRPPLPLATQSFIFNEIGNAADDTHDWIELKNLCNVPLDLSDWQIRLMREDFFSEAIEVVSFPDVPLPAQDVLLITNTDPSETRLASGLNIATGARLRGAQHPYLVAPDLKLPRVPYLLILQRKGTENGDPPATIEDVAGNYFRTVSPYTTEVYPIANTSRPKAAAAPLTDVGVYQRQHLEQPGYLAAAWRPSAYHSGLGYDRQAEVSVSLGTPGYRLDPSPSQPVAHGENDPGAPGSGAVVGFNATLPDEVRFSELMFETEGASRRLPQWIELYNASATPVDLKDWQLTVETRTAEKHRHATLTLNPMQIPPKQTVLLVVGTGRNDVALPPERVYDLSAAHPDVFHNRRLRNTLLTLLGSEGFFLKLIHPTGRVVDTCGNLDGDPTTKDPPTWTLPDKKTPLGDRTSLLRRFDGDMRKGTEASGWQRAADVALAVTHYYGYPRDISTPGFLHQIVPGNSPTVALSISEIMFAAHPQRPYPLPQWIELYNPSLTGPVNLKDFQCIIETRQDGKHHQIVMDLEAFDVLPNQTVLLITGAGRHSGHFPANRTYNLSQRHPKAFRSAEQWQRLLGSEGFLIQLTDATGNVVDTVGNLDGTPFTEDTPAWTLPDGETPERARASIRRLTEKRIPLDGRHHEAWVSTAAAPPVIMTYYGHRSDVGNPMYRMGGPLPVVLSSFKAVRDTDDVVVSWTTESSLENAGFNILRSTARKGSFIRVNPKLIQGAGTTAERRMYTYVDKPPKADVVYYYQIEEVSYSGQSQVLATARIKGHLSADGKHLTTLGALKTRQ